MGNKIANNKCIKDASFNKILIRPFLFRPNVQFHFATLVLLLFLRHTCDDRPTPGLLIFQLLSKFRTYCYDCPTTHWTAALGTHDGDVVARLCSHRSSSWCPASYTATKRCLMRCRRTKVISRILMGNCKRKDDFTTPCVRLDSRWGPADDQMAN